MECTTIRARVANKHYLNLTLLRFLHCWWRRKNITRLFIWNLADRDTIFRSVLVWTDLYALPTCQVFISVFYLSHLLRDNYKPFCDVDMWKQAAAKSGTFIYNPDNQVTNE